MQGKNSATCSICGSSYDRCLSCRDTIKLQPWKMFTDSAEHYKVFQAIRGYNTGVYTKDEFKSKLKNIDLSDLENYKENVKALIKDVLKEKSVTKIVSKVEESIKVETVTEEEPIKVETVTATEEVAVEKPVVSRKRNYKIDKVESEETE